MRLKKEDKVEVRNNDDTAVSWRVAKILSSNGHSYHVVYDSYPGMKNKQIAETVSRKLVRPCPPVVQGVKNCSVGDIVEVFCEFTWKMAAILSVLKGKKGTRSKKIYLRYLARIVGCSEEIIVNESNVRMRQIWHDDKWVLIEKNFRGGVDAIANKLITSNFYQNMNGHDLQINARTQKRPRNDYLNTKDETALSKSYLMHSRAPNMLTPPIIEAFNVPAEKLRAVERDGKRQRVESARIPEKVHAVSYPREILGGKNMHASVKILSTGHNQIEWANLNSGSDSDDACSVGSCSMANRNPNNICIPFISSICRETEAVVCSDAESCYGSFSERKSSFIPLKGKVESNIHSLELHAYRRTLEALYASGPLSWEQEALLTNLRIMLHISNDEHLMELKNLISTKNVISFR